MNSTVSDRYRFAWTPARSPGRRLSSVRSSLTSWMWVVGYHRRPGSAICAMRCCNADSRILQRRFLARRAFRRRHPKKRIAENRFCATHFCQRRGPQVIRPPKKIRLLASDPSNAQTSGWKSNLLRCLWMHRREADMDSRARKALAVMKE